MNTKNHTLNASRSGFYLKALPSAILAACLLPAVASSANLLVDSATGYNIGSFEQLALPTGATDPFYLEYLNGDVSSITGWTVDAQYNPTSINGGPTVGKMDITRNGNAGGFVASQGTQLLDLAAAEGFDNGVLSKPITVIPGQKYRLTFDIGNHDVFRSSVGVALTGGKWSDNTSSTTEKKLVSAVSPGTPQNDWRTVTLEWTPDAGITSTTISFYGRNPTLLDSNLKGYPSPVAGFSVDASVKASYPELTLGGTVPAINFDENITVDNVSLELIPATPNLVGNGSFETPTTTSYATYTDSQPVDSSNSWTAVADVSLGVNIVNGTGDSQGLKLGNGNFYEKYGSLNPPATLDGSVALVKTATGTSTTLAVDKYAASEGDQFMDLAGVHGFDKGIVSAPIDVVAGKRYTLSVDIGSYDQYFSTVGISMTNGTWADDGTDASTLANEKLFFNHTKALRGSTENTTNWKTVTVTFVASSTGTTQIKLMGRDPHANAKLAIGTKPDGSPLTSTPIVNVVGAYAQTYDAAILVDNVKLQEESNVSIPSAPLRTAYIGKFNNDANADILWRDGSAVYRYDMNGYHYTKISVDTMADTNWQIKGTGDYNGDGKADILWRNIATGQTQMGLTSVGTLPVQASAELSWEIVGSGDYNGDGKADILWKNSTTGVTVMYLMNGNNFISAREIEASKNLDLKIVGNGDYNGDGKADLLWKNSITGETVIYLMSGVNFIAAKQIPVDPSINWKVVGSGDYDGDGKADILWKNSANGLAVMYLMNGLDYKPNGTAFVPASLDLAWKIVGSGDFNGDGKSDILWQHDSGYTVAYIMNGIVTDFAQSGALTTP